jgi:hypothetical protein
MYIKHDAHINSGLLKIFCEGLFLFQTKETSSCQFNSAGNTKGNSSNIEDARFHQNSSVDSNSL